MLLLDAELTYFMQVLCVDAAHVLTQPFQKYY